MNLTEWHEIGSITSRSHVSVSDNSGLPATALATGMIFDLFSGWLDIFGEEKGYSRSRRCMNSLDVPIEIGGKSVNQFASKTAFQGCGGRAIIAYAANDLSGGGFNRDRNEVCLGHKRVTLGIRDELRDNQLCSPTTFGIEHDGFRNCQMQFNTALRKSGRSQGVAKLGQIGTQISQRCRQGRS